MSGVQSQTNPPGLAWLGRQLCHVASSCASRIMKGKYKHRYTYIYICIYYMYIDSAQLKTTDHLYPVLSSRLSNSLLEYSCQNNCEVGLANALRMMLKARQFDLADVRLCPEYVTKYCSCRSPTKHYKQQSIFFGLISQRLIHKGQPFERQPTCPPGFRLIGVLPSSQETTSGNGLQSGCHK